jgi:hypothetical protein
MIWYEFVRELARDCKLRGLFVNSTGIENGRIRIGLEIKWASAKMWI